MLSANIEALRAVRDHIKWHPETHNQTLWAAVPGPLSYTADDRWGHRYAVAEWASAACVAGWACLLHGDRLACFECERVRDEYLVHKVVTKRGQLLNVDDRAARLLGLTQRESVELFDVHQSHDDVLDLLDLLIKGEPTQRMRPAPSLRQWLD